MLWIFLHGRFIYHGRVFATLDRYVGHWYSVALIHLEKLQSESEGDKASALPGWSQCAMSRRFHVPGEGISGLPAETFGQGRSVKKTYE